MSEEFFKKTFASRTAVYRKKIMEEQKACMKLALYSKRCNMSAVKGSAITHFYSFD